MNIGDILSLRLDRPPFHADAKLTVIQPGDSQGTTEMFTFEFITGPLDGSEVRMTRLQLDINQGREGGEEWKQSRQT